MKHRAGIHPSLHIALPSGNRSGIKKGSLAFTATNPFNEYINQRTLIFGPGFYCNKFAEEFLTGLSELILPGSLEN